MTMSRGSFDWVIHSGTLDALHPGAFAMVDADELAGAEPLQQVVRICVHCSHSLIALEQAAMNGRMFQYGGCCIARERGSNERFSSMGE